MRALSLIVLLLPSYLLGGWTRIRTFSQPLSCGFFLSQDRGFVGTCNYFEYGEPQIWRTVDGGTSWTQSVTPSLGFRAGRVSSIFMKTALIGYATVTEENYGFSNVHSLWKTTDGGVRWFDHTQGNRIEAGNVYATSAALMVTGWSRFGSDVGGRSFDDGATYDRVFSSPTETESNGIDFSDDLQGVVTPGPSLNGFIRNNYTRPCYFTSNGGRTWTQGGDISESWSVYALKNTSTFFALPEGYANDTQQDVVRTTNLGQTWQTIFSFSGSRSFTGHIDGLGSHLYVQTDNDENSGLFRSDDLGFTWKNVGGPSNRRDTRFVVTGCEGQIVYAFDISGGLWKTEDGGDGTLALEQVELKTPEPLPDNSVPFIFGDTVRIPVYLQTDALKLKSFRTRVGMNTDFLEPFDVWTLGTLSEGASAVVTSDISGAGIEVTFPVERTITRTNSTIPLCYILARVYLTRDTATDLTLDSFEVTETGASPRNILSCLAPDGTSLSFTMNLRCGAPTLYHFIRDEPILGFSFIRPNPNPTGVVEVGVNSQYEGAVSIEIVDALGRVVRRIDGQSLIRGENTIKVTAHGISGIYYFRIHSLAGSIHSRPILFVK